MANAAAKTDANNKSEVSGGPGLGFLDVITNWGINTENKYTGDGRTQRTGNLNAEITARITEVLHNGDYRLAGTRKSSSHHCNEVTLSTGGPIYLARL